MSHTSLNSSSTQLFWDDRKKETKQEDEEGDVEELDYDESMENLDLHPTDSIDDLEGEESHNQRLTVVSNEAKLGETLMY